MADRHIGKIELVPDLVLSWLQFPFGRLRDISYDEERDIVSLLIEDSEMPIVRQGEIPLTQLISFSTYQDCVGHKVSLREKIK